MEVAWRTRHIHFGIGGTCHTDNDRIDHLQMAGVRRHVDEHVHLLVAARGTIGAHVILHIARPAKLIPGSGATLRVGKFRQDLAVWLVQDMCQYVEASAVCHADERDADRFLRGIGDDLIQHGDHHIQPFDGETRFAGVEAMKKDLEGFHLGQPFQQFPSIHRLRRRAEATALRSLKQPLPFFGNVDVTVIVADRSAVNGTQNVDCFFCVPRGPALRIRAVSQHRQAGLPDPLP